MDRRYSNLVLAVIVLVSVATPVLGASGSAEFGTDVVETTAGETAEIPVTLSNAETATVKIGSENVNYVATVVVRDGNGDGTVTLLYDTSKAGHGGAFSVAGDADEASVRTETQFDDDHRLAAGAYPLAVAPGNASVENETGVATLTVVEQSDSDAERETETATPSPYAGHVTDIDGGVIVAPAENQTITGTLDLAPGTEITVVARKGGAFLKTNATTVSDDGQFRASFDFSDLPTEFETGNGFNVVVRAGDEDVTEVTGVIRSPPTTTTTETTEATEQAVQDETNRTPTPAQDGSIPGFGFGVVVVALMGVALLGLRRKG